MSLKPIVKILTALLIHVSAGGIASGQDAPAPDTSTTATAPVFPDFFPLMAWDDVENE